MASPIEVAEHVRQRVLAYHALLRGLLEALAVATQLAASDEKQRPNVRGLLAHVRSEVERHLAYEDEVLVPILRDADAWGAVRVELMTKEHEQQRLLVCALAEDAEDGVRRIDDLCEEISWFVQSFLEDMAREEQRILTPDALGEEIVPAEQIDG
jgi:iron-sulfur cluster repair protein YtfE (RIC family)